MASPMNRSFTSRAVWQAILANMSLCLPPAAWSGDLVGKRLFPSTIVIEEPTVEDELIVTGGHIRERGESGSGSTTESELEVKYSKRLGETFAVMLAGKYVRLNPAEGSSEYGLGNVEVGARYRFHSNAKHESIASVGLEIEIGNTGDPDVEAGHDSIVSPVLLFGKGFGDLPWQGVKYLKPLAVQGILGANFPTDSEADGEPNPVSASSGLALIYDLSYLHEHVNANALPSFLDRIVLLSEFLLETCLNRGCDGEVSGTVSPGALWLGERVWLGMEASIPLNDRAGDDLGVLGLFRLSLGEEH